jgi:hypothetical protein
MYTNANKKRKGVNYKQRGPTAHVVCPRSMKENAREAAYKVDERRTQSGGRCPWSMKKNAQEREYSADSAESTHPSWAVDVHGPVQLHLGEILGGDGALVDGHREVAQADLGKHAKSFSSLNLLWHLKLDVCSSRALLQSTVSTNSYLVLDIAFSAFRYLLFRTTVIYSSPLQFFSLAYLRTTVPICQSGPEPGSLGPILLFNLP